MRNERETSQSGDAFPRGIGNPATRALIAAGYTSVEQLSDICESDLLKLHGVGPKAIRIVKVTLAERSLPPLKP